MITDRHASPARQHVPTRPDADVHFHRRSRTGRATHIPGPRVRPVVLLILDGFGSREAAPDNAISNALMPNWTRLLATSPHTTIDASELHVGLPTGQMGNSEVGHSEYRRGSRDLPGFHAHRPRHRDGRFRPQSRARRGTGDRRPQRFSVARAGIALPGWRP